MNHDDFQRFSAEHGESIVKDGLRFWPDGWYMENMGGAQPRQPESERQRLKNVKKYYETMLERVLKMFDNTKRMAKAKANQGVLTWIEKKEATEKLTELSKRGKEYRKQLAAVEKELEPLIPAKRAEMQRGPQPDHEALQALDAIEI